jgi:hypothetical protein
MDSGLALPPETVHWWLARNWSKSPERASIKPLTTSTHAEQAIAPSLSQRLFESRAQLIRTLDDMKSHVKLRDDIAATLHGQVQAMNVCQLADRRETPSCSSATRSAG